MGAAGAVAASAPAEVDLGTAPPESVPLALARVHRSLAAGSVVRVVLPASLGRDLSSDVLVGGGFAPRPRGQARREVSLPDTVGPGMRLLVCGLNPSPAAADAGVGYFRAGNRFWPAAQEAGLVSRDRDPRHALVAHGIGMTDLVKRTTARADELDADEYRAGVARLDRLCAWLRPDAVCLVGLAGWRAAVDRRAAAGRQERTLGGRPVHLMPSTSGLNAATSMAVLVDHLRAAADLADAESPGRIPG